MKKHVKKAKGIVKGAPSGLVISLIVHAAVFMLAGLLVVFNVVKKEEKKFVPPPPVERPKMKLKKPKPRVKKSSKPKSVSRIVTTVKKADMPDIQLPEMSGMGEGLAGGLGGGFDLMPDLGDVTLFGGGQSIGNDLVGTFYDFKRDRNGRLNTMDDSRFVDELARFVSSGWKKTVLARFYRSPKKLYATCIMMPPIPSYVAPAAFGENDTVGHSWLVHYEGQLVHKDGLKFRFWGHGDDVLVVRVDGKVVLNACWPDGQWNTAAVVDSSWLSDSADSRKYYLGNNLAAVGDLITLEPGVPKDMEIMIGEVPGGTFTAMLTVEVEGEEYERNGQQCPILPMFKTAEPTFEMIDAISEHLVPDEVAITNGPVFSDYATSRRSLAREPETLQDADESSESALRLWTIGNDKTLEAEYLSIVAGNAILRKAKGKQLKVPVETMSAADREYIELIEVPAFDVNFIKQSDNVINRYKLSPKELDWNRTPARVNDFTFGASIRQTEANEYNHELTIEYFALGQQMLDDQKYVLLDHRTDRFLPGSDNNRSHRFTGDPVELVEYDFGGVLEGQRRGRKYAEHLVLVTDKRGEIIEYSSSASWLYEHLENLRKLPLGAFMDRTCTRVHPTGPKSTLY